MQEKTDKDSRRKAGKRKTERSEPELPGQLDKEHGEEVAPAREKIEPSSNLRTRRK